MKNKKTLFVLSSDKRAKQYLVDTIQAVIGNEVDIKGFSLDEGVSINNKPVPVLTSGEFLVDIAARLFPNSNIIGAKRIITGYNLEKVIMLPKGKKVLIVNNPRSTAEETIECLINLGIDHLEYIPYWKGREVDISEIDTAVSPGLIHQCPENIKNKIEIGARTISPYTFLRVLEALNLDHKYLEDFNTYYSNHLIEVSRKLAQINEQSEMLRKNQEVIINEIDEGIVLLDENSAIKIMNSTVKKLFGSDAENFIGTDIKGFFTKLKKVKSAWEDKTSNDKTAAIYSYNGHNLLVSKISVTANNSRNYIYTFKEVEKIRNLEETVRIKLLEKGYVAKYKFDDIWTINNRMKAIKEKAERFARTNKNILIIGESGTGKELFAQAIHNESQRKKEAFVAVNFAALPENLVESELFGYEDGAFTGAKKGGKLGLFEQAHGGTIFLDEIGDTALCVQTRLLRVLQEKEIMRVGGNKIIPIDVRIIAATNKNLKSMVDKGLFREDLYYRINVLPLEIPPLRDRTEDILYFLNRYLECNYKLKKVITPEALEAISRYRFPGNTRELINVAEYLCYSTGEKEIITYDDLPPELKSAADYKNEDTDKLLQILKSLLERNADLGVVNALLKIMAERRGLGTGRLVLREKLAEEKIDLTERQVKWYIKELQQRSLVAVGRKKQGTTITGEGRIFSDYLNYTQTGR